jgi:hypothetical protein
VSVDDPCTTMATARERASGQAIQVHFVLAAEYSGTRLWIQPMLLFREVANKYEFTLEDVLV